MILLCICDIEWIMKIYYVLGRWTANWVRCVRNKLSARNKKIKISNLHSKLNALLVRTCMKIYIKLHLKKFCHYQFVHYSNNQLLEFYIVYCLIQSQSLLDPLLGLLQQVMGPGIPKKCVLLLVTKSRSICAIPDCKVFARQFTQCLRIFNSWKWSCLRRGQWLHF